MGNFVASASRYLQRFGWTPREFRQHGRLLSSTFRNSAHPIQVADVGAHLGDWSRSMKNHLPRGSRFTLVEANPEHGEHLSPLGTYVNAVLSDSEKEVSFFSTGGTGDSYKVEIGEHYKDVVPKLVRAMRADQISQIPHNIDVLKVDTQGSELEVLNGFGNKLDPVKLVIMEVPIVNYNSGAPDFSTYIEFMKSKGFRVTHVLDNHLRDGEIIALDLAFQR